MKQIISTVFLSILILFKMEAQAQSFKTIETNNLNFKFTTHQKTVLV